MNQFLFEETPWELYAGKLRSGDRISASRFLTLLEGESEDAVEDAFLLLEEREVALELSDLPKPVLSGETGKRLALEEKLAREADLLLGLTPEDPLRMYLEELAALPAFGDMELLALDLAEGKGGEAAQAQLVNLCLSRVVELARSHVGRGVLLMDLIQEGSMGLWQGILSYNGQKPFWQVRDWWICQYMAKAVVLQARENGVGGKLRKAMEEYRAVDRRLLGQLGRNPTLEEIALELHMTPEETFTIQDMLRSAQATQKNQPAQDDAAEEARHVEDTAYFQMRQRITELLSVLPETEARILTLRFGLEGGLPLDPVQTGARLGLTAEEVTRMEAAALSKLRSDI